MQEQLTADALTSLQRTAGNLAVAQLVASSQHGQVAQRGPDDGEDDGAGTDVEPWIATLQDRLVGQGVSRKELGTVESFRELGEAEAERLLGKLVQYKTDPGLSFTSSSKIVRSWNGRRDDLGVGGRSGYKTILHYVSAMERLANSSLSGEWPDNLKVMRKAIRVGGASFHVHPRMLYFAAAAQVGMNEAAEMASDEGHYLAPAVVFEELRIIRQAAVLVDDLAANVEKAHAATGSTDPAPGLNGAALVYANLASRLKHIAGIRASQLAGGAGTLDHPEPLADHMDESMAAEIERLPESADDDADAVTRCRQIMVLLWYKPQKRQAHGWGAGDPHGTHHALGMAMDAYYGTGKGGYSNSFKFLQGDTAATIAAWMVSEYGADYGLTAEAPKQLARQIRTDPEAGRAFAVLLRDHASDAMSRFERAVVEEKDPEAQRLLSSYKRLRRSIVVALRSRHSVAKRVLADRALMRAVPTLKPYVATILGEHSAAKVAKHQHPAPFLEAAQAATGSYEALRVSLELLAPATVRPGLAPDDSPDAAALLAELEVELGDLTNAVEAKEVATLRRRMPAGFRRTLDRAASGTLVLDQPLEVLRGFASVQGARLQSGHHFQVTDWTSLLKSKKVYTSKVVADMKTRGPDGVRQILQVMAQTPAGYAAVFDAETENASIVPALREWGKTSKADVDAMLEAVHDLLPPPAMEGIDAKRKQLASDLYARGFYDVALTVASPGGTP